MRLILETTHIRRPVAAYAPKFHAVVGHGTIGSPMVCWKYSKPKHRQNTNMHRCTTYVLAVTRTDAACQWPQQSKEVAIPRVAEPTFSCYMCRTAGSEHVNNDFGCFTACGAKTLLCRSTARAKKENVNIRKHSSTFMQPLLTACHVDQTQVQLLSPYNAFRILDTNLRPTASCPSASFWAARRHSSDVLIWSLCCWKRQALKTKLQSRSVY